MKKYGFLNRLLAMLTAFALLLGMTGTVVFATTGTWDQNYLIEQAVAAEGAPVSAIGDSIEYVMLKGDFFGGGTLSQFSTFVTTSPMVMGDSTESARIFPWQIKATAGTDAILKITAKQDLYMKLWQNADTTTTWVNNMQICYVVENAAGTQITLKTLTVTANETISAADYDTQLHMAAGDTVYVIYHMTSGSGTYASNMRLTVDTDAYDSSLRTSFGTVGSFDLTQMTKTAYNSAEDTTVYSAVGDTVQYALLSGDFVGGGTLTAMGKSQYPYMMGTENPNAFIRNYDGQFGAHKGTDAVLKVTAQENMRLNIGVVDGTARSTGSGWAHNASFLYVLESAGGKRLTLDTIPVTQADMAAELFARTLHLRQGESFYIVYTYTGTAAVGNTVANLDVQFDVDTDAYDESLCAQYGVSGFLDQNSLVTGQISAQGAPVTALSDSIEYVMLKGDYFGGGELSRYTVFTENTVGDSNEMVAIRPWQILSTLGKDFVMQITAKQAMELTFSQHTDTEDNWATGSAIYYAVENAEGTRVTVKKLQITSGTMSKELYDQQLHLAQGDKAYFIYHYTGTNENTCVVTPSNMRVSVDTEAYDASKRVDFTQPEVDPDGCIHSYVTTVLTPAGTFTAGLAQKTCSLCGNTVTQELPATNSIKILLVGNSHTMNFSTYLWQILRDLGVETVIIGNANIGGTLMDTHWANMVNDSASYTYYKNVSGTWVATANTRLSTAVADEDWDLITFQQRGYEAGVASAYGNIANVLNYLDTNKTNPYAKIYWPMTWAFQKDTVNASFESYYGSDQTTMYEMIVDVVQNVVEPQPLIYDVIPMGTAMQNARTSALGDTLMVDGVHANDTGCYIAGLTFAAKVLDVEPSEISWAPEGLSQDCMDIAAESAANAIAQPYAVTQSQITGEIDMPDRVSTLQHQNMVSNQVYSQGAPITATGVTYQYLYGDVESGEMYAFTDFTGDGSGAANDVVGGSDGNNAIWRWQWKANATYESILRITATEDIKLTLSHPQTIAESSIWAFHSAFRLYTENAVGTLVELAEYPVEAPMDTAAINAVVHMAEGDSIYIVYAMDPGYSGYVVSGLIPYFTVNQDAYDPQLRTDFGNEDPVGYPKTWSLGLRDDISVKFDMCVRAEAADVLITVNGTQTVISDVTDGQRISVDMAPAQMTDTIFIRLMDKNGNESQTYQYTVRQYCDAVLEGRYSECTKALVRAMLNYGGKAQTYFDYNADNLANAGITVQESDVPAERPAVSITGAASGVSFYGATLLFQSRTALRMYFKVSDGAVHTFANADGSLTYTPVVKGNLCYVEIDGISPADLDESFRVTVDGTLSVTYGPMDYIRRMYNRTDGSQALKDVAGAMYTYWSAAEDYLVEQSYGADQSNLYGMCYIAFEGVGNGIDYEKAFKLLSNLGVTSVRQWMHMTWFIDEDFNVIEENVALMKDILAQAQKYDIQLIGMSHRNINKYGSEHENSKIGRDSDYYDEWIANYEKGWYMLASLFPEITIWEIDNETNNEDFMTDAEGGTFTAQEMADISTDMFFYGSRGVHEANPDATTVMGGFLSWDNGQFLELVYENILSGEFGEGSTDPDDYFQALAWHPYMWDWDVEEFIKINQDLYDIAYGYEMKHKKVYLTELGGWDHNVKSGLAPELAAQYVTELYTLTAEQLPFVESMHYFRAFDNILDNNNQYGLFADPNPERQDICGGERLTPGMPKLTALAYQEAAGGEGSLELLQTELDADSFYDLEKATQPLWQGTTVYNDTVCFAQQENGQILSGQLLYTPEQILYVRSADLQTLYREGVDYTLTDGQLVRTENSRIPVLTWDKYCQAVTGAASDAWLTMEDGINQLIMSHDLMNYQISVTYTHADTWDGFQPQSQTAYLPKTVSALENRQDLNIVFYGDSITAGWDASGQNETVINMNTLNTMEVVTQRTPFMPTWAQMAVQVLEDTWGYDAITKCNRAAGGADSAWGSTNAAKLVVPEDPDLVVIAFGMNETWRTASAYKANIASILDTIHAAHPEAEFLLVSSMLPNRDAASLADHYLLEQEAALYALQEERTDLRIGVVPVQSMYQSLETMGKLYTDYSSNNVNHPNDFSVRIYAQMLLAALTPTEE